MLDKYTRASLLQAGLGSDECMSEFNMFKRAHSLIRSQRGKKDISINEIELVIDAMGDTWSEDELLEYLKMVNSDTFISIRYLLGKFEENYYKRVSNAIATTDNPEGMDRATESHRESL